MRGTNNIQILMQSGLFYFILPYFAKSALVKDISIVISLLQKSHSWSKYLVSQYQLFSIDCQHRVGLWRFTEEEKLIYWFWVFEKV